jgi:hypothetical protein
VKIIIFSISVKAEKAPPFPWLKSRGSIETFARDNGKDLSVTSPWLKSRGSIETI